MASKRTLDRPTAPALQRRSARAGYHQSLFWRCYERLSLFAGNADQGPPAPFPEQRRRRRIHGLRSWQCDVRAGTGGNRHARQANCQAADGQVVGGVQSPLLCQPG